MRYTQRVAINVAVQVAGRAIMLAAGLVTLRLATAMLGAERYGDYAIAGALALVAGIATDLGLALFSVRELAITADRQAFFPAMLGLRLVTALPVLVLAPLLAVCVPGYAAEVRGAALGLAIAQAALLVHLAAATWFHVALRFDLVVGSEVAGRLVTLGGLWWFGARLTPDAALPAVVQCVVAGSLTTLACTGLALWTAGVRARPRWDTALSRRALRQALPLAGLGTLALLHARADSFVLSLVRPAIDVGLYAVAYKVLEILVTFAPMFAGVLLPRFIATCAGGGQAEIAPLFVKALRAALLVALPAAAFTAVHATTIVRVIQGQSGFEPAAVPLRILAAALPALFASSLGGMLLVALGRQRVVLAPLAGLVGLNVLLNLWLAPRYSYHASAWITFGTEALAAALFLWKVRDVVRPRAWIGTLAHAAMVLALILIPAVWLVAARHLDAAVAAARTGLGYGILAGAGALWFVSFVAAALATRFLRPAELRGLWPSLRAAR